MKIYMFLLLWLSFISLSQGQERTLAYDLMHKNKVIGSLIATRQTNGSSEIYVVKTEITKKILHVKHCTYDLIIHYEDGKLKSSDYKLYVNEKLDKKTMLVQKGGQLIAMKNDKPKKMRKKEIDFSSALLYFKEPAGITETFSEPNLKSRHLAPHKSKAHTYVLDKNVGEYYYENGELQRMVYDELVKIELIKKSL